MTGDQEKSGGKSGRRNWRGWLLCEAITQKKNCPFESIAEQYGEDHICRCDGINDAPVLAGVMFVRMGSGADAAIEAADVVFMNSRLSGIRS